MLFGRIFLPGLVLCALAAALSGCATIPAGGGLPVYTIGGTAYYPLAGLCDQRGVEMKYDSLLRTVRLSKDSHQVILRAGDILVLVDGNVMRLSSPVDIYRGVLAVPKEFKDQVFDLLFSFSVPPVSRTRRDRIKLRKVIIDPGHGGNDPGAIGKYGLKEKDVNLDIAKRLSRLLRAEGVQVVLTRSTDKFIPLPMRAELANRSGADLFISLHANAARSRSLNGFEVYYVAPSVSDSRRAYLTARSTPLNLKNASFSGEPLELKAIIWDMIYTNSRAESIELSRSLCGSMRDNVGMNILGAKSARFQVLKGITMPGVLVEAGFVSNLKEEKLLKTGSYREKLAAGILEGIREYSQEMSPIDFSR